MSVKKASSYQMILEEVDNGEYEPTLSELHEYAREIGINVEEEPQLMPLAVQGIRAPLPDNWRACQTDEGKIYFFNFANGESRWDHPCDEVYRKLVAIERKRASKKVHDLVIDEFVMNECISEENTDSGCSANIEAKPPIPTNRNTPSVTITRQETPRNQPKIHNASPVTRKKKFEHATDVSGQGSRVNSEAYLISRPRDFTSPTESDVELVSRLLPIKPRTNNARDSCDSMQRFRSKKYRIGDSDIDLVRTDNDEGQSVDKSYLSDTDNIRSKVASVNTSENEHCTEKHVSHSIVMTSRESELIALIQQKDDKISQLADHISKLELRLGDCNEELERYRSALQNVTPLRLKSENQFLNTPQREYVTSWGGAVLRYDTPDRSIPIGTKSKRTRSMHATNRHNYESSSDDLNPTERFIDNRTRRKMRKRRQVRSNQKPSFSSQMDISRMRDSYNSVEAPVIALRSSRRYSSVRGVVNATASGSVCKMDRFNSNPYLLSAACSNDESKHKPVIIATGCEANASDISEKSGKGHVISFRLDKIVDAHAHCEQSNEVSNSDTDTINREIRVRNFRESEI